MAKNSEAKGTTPRPRPQKLTSGPAWRRGLDLRPSTLKYEQMLRRYSCVKNIFKYHLLYYHLKDISHNFCCHFLYASLFQWVRRILFTIVSDKVSKKLVRRTFWGAVPKSAFGRWPIESTWSPWRPVADVKIGKIRIFQWAQQITIGTSS